MAVSQEQCRSCKRIASQYASVITLENTLDADSQALREFFKRVNGLLNDKGGAVVIHTSDQTLLERFDQKVDDKLSAMIPDGRLYHRVYERSFFDAKHLVYVVKPSSKEQPLSTMDFKTYSPENKGKMAVTHSQMAMMISDVCLDAKPYTSSDSDDDIAFDNDEEVLLKRDYGTEHFQECVNLQAKHVTESDSIALTQLVNRCWSLLAPYVCCFTQIESGGSVYFGVSEEKKSSPLWNPARPKSVQLTHFGRRQGWEIWQDGIKSDVYYVAREGRIKHEKTGKFLTKPVTLSVQNREAFCHAILNKVENDLMWVGKAAPMEPVQVRFHPVTNAAQDKCVIQIKINYYHGLCFCSKDGPESFRCRFHESGTPSPPDVKQIGFSEWINRFKPGAATILRVVQVQRIN